MSDQKSRKSIKELIQELSLYSYFDESKEEQAKMLIDRFFVALSEIKSSDELEQSEELCGIHNYYSFLPYLLRIRKLLMTHKYSKVCDELYTLCHFENIFQERIYKALIILYNDYQRW